MTALDAAGPQHARRPTVLVFAGLDPSGGAGIAADLCAIGAQGVHALPLVTALTVQDNNHVFDVAPVDPALLLRQAALLIEAVEIDAVKIGIPGNLANALVIAGIIERLRQRRPQLPVVLDPVLASGHGDALARGNALEAIAPLLALATLVVPNLREAEALDLMACPNVLITGGHGHGLDVENIWHHDGLPHTWRFERLPGEFHGSGCTLAAAIAACLARGDAMWQALDTAQAYTHRTLAQSFQIAPGQRIPERFQQAQS